jgi:hypothetical protein
MASQVGVEAFAQSIVRDYLRERGLTDTLDTLSQESTKRGFNPPSVESWYEVSGKLGLAELIRENKSSEGKNYGTILEVLLQHLSDMSQEKRLEARDVVITVSDRIKMSDRNKGAMIAMQQSEGPAYSHSTLAESSMGDRPSFRDRDDRKGQRQVGPVRSSDGVNQQMDKSFAMRKDNSRMKAPTPMANAGKSITKSKPLSKYKMHSASSKTLSMHSSDGGEEDSVHEPSQESWIPMETRMRMMRDEIAVSRNREEGREREERRLMKSVVKAPVDPRVDEELKHVFRELPWEAETTTLQLEKDKEKLSQKKRQACALCKLDFLAVNLPMTVSYKAIMDMRQSWGNVEDYNTVLARPPRCYDRVRVCIFCAQFFDGPGGQEVYRPIGQNTGQKGDLDSGGRLEALESTNGL